MSAHQVPELSRFVVTEDGVTAVLTYVERADAVVLEHTLVPPELAGRAVGSELVRTALTHFATAGRPVVPQCPFVQAWLQRHPGDVDVQLLPVT